MNQKDSKVVQLIRPATDEREDYPNEVTKVNDVLVNISEKHGEPIRAVLADLTYIVVGRDIMATIEAGCEED